MDIHQLEIFVTVARRGGFQAAAEELHLAQSTVSSHIAALERELGTQLIQRTTHSFRLLPRGQELLDYADRILLLHRRAKEQISREHRCHLDIGASSVPARCLVPELICAFHREQPQVSLNVEYSDSVNIIRAVEDQRLDVGFVGTATDAACRFLPLCRDEMILAAPNTAHYRELQSSGADLSVLLREPFLLREQESGTRREMERFLRAAGLSEGDLTVAARFNDFEALKLCLIKGLGVSVLSRRSVEEELRRGDLLAFSLDQEGNSRMLYLVWREGNYLSPALRDFLKFCRDRFGQ